VNVDGISLARVGEVVRDVLRSFSCADPDLDEFLHDQAVDYDEHGLTATTIVFQDQDPVPIAFFSLSADSLLLEGVELTELGLPFDAPILFYPAIKITKLAVRAGMQSRGIGEVLIKFIQGMVFDSQFSVRLLTVNAVNRERTLAFYERVGFHTSHINEQKKQDRRRERDTILMYKDIYAE